MYCKKAQQTLEEEKIIRFLNNLSSLKEKREVLDWLEQPGADEEVIRHLADRWEKQTSLPVSKDKAQQLLDKIHEASLNKKPSPSKQFLPKLDTIVAWGRIAATYFLVAFSLYFLREGFLYEKPTPIDEARIATLVERKTQAGEKMIITLPDKSTVLLNSLSELRFYSDYGMEKREIELVGEAFFEVAENKEIPFEVIVGDITTTALGTAFNVFNRGGLIKIALTEGRVRVATKADGLELIPGEMALNKGKANDKLSKRTFDLLETTGWKEGQISFKSKKFGEILATLEAWYGVNFVVHNELNMEREITGVFKNENLKDILTGLGYFMHFDYKLEGKKATLNPTLPME
nr:DUF4974 domain-containing protein [Cytophagales bacterium]